jgi:hypothetical protein
MENRMNPDAFEQALRQSLDKFEVPYNSADWALMERELNKTSAKQGRWSAGLLALLFGGGLALTTTVYYMSSTSGGLVTANQEPIQEVALPVNAQSDPVLATTESRLETADRQVQFSNASTEASVIAPEKSKPAPKVTLNPELSQSNIPTQVSGGPALEPEASSNEVSIKPSITEGCPGTSVEFEVTNLPAPGTRMLWNFGDGSFSTDPTPKHAYNKAGRYEVTLSMSSATGGTIFNKPVSDVIVIHERPEAAFNPMVQEYLDRVPSVHFENKSLKGTTYFWDFGDGQTSSLQVPTHVYKKHGDYAVSLVATNAIGCTDRTERMVRIKEDYNLLAAPAFSPNGDGVEENFIPEALKTLNRRFRMTVVDPSTGALLFETSDAKRPWNGRVNGTGAPCATGDYVWMVEMKDGEALGGTYNGTVSLLR